MRGHLPLTALILVCAQPVAAFDLPARKPGLWEIKMTVEGRNTPAQASQHCIDAETDKLMSSIGGSMRQDMCSKQDVQKVGSTIVIDSVCKIGPATTTSRGVVSGDFNSAYTTKITSKWEGGPPAPGMPADGTTNMTIDAKWLSDCGPDQKPGDMIMAGGRKMNIRDLQTIMPGGPEQKNLPRVMPSGPRPDTPPKQK
jgi:Protein of unknown function (DUF3617)